MQRVKRVLVANILAIPGIAVNYAVLILLIQILHFSGFWVLSGVLVADIIGLAFNSYMVDWNIKIAMKFKSYREIVAKSSTAS